MIFKLKFMGGADTVTGSRTMVAADDTAVLVDCGQFQGPKEIRDRNWSAFPEDVSNISAVILTHAHLDHSGYLPKLVHEGFRGPVYCSAGTYDVAQILLRDAAYLEEEFSDYANQTGYSNHKPALPLFTMEDAEKALTLLKPCKRHEWYAVTEAIQFRLHRGGHIPGASMVEVAVNGRAPTRTIVFSGDLGNDRLVTMRCPEPFPPCDVLVLESTYGARLQPREDLTDALAKIINDVAARKGVLVVPAFAVGRAQEIIYRIRLLEDEGRIPILPVVLDSPMAQRSTQTYLNHPDDHRLDLMDPGEVDVFKPARFEISQTPDESMLWTMHDGPFIVISAAGMLSGGRILHHLKARLPFPENCVLFSGYQAEGTKGRFLQDNAGSLKTLRIHHQEIPLAAEVATLDGLSSHADYDDILKMLSKMRQLPKTIILNHGSIEGQTGLRDKIKERFGVDAVCALDKPTWP